MEELRSWTEYIEAAEEADSNPRMEAQKEKVLLEPRCQGH